MIRFNKIFFLKLLSFIFVISVTIQLTLLLNISKSSISSYLYTSKNNTETFQLLPWSKIKPTPLHKPNEYDYFSDIINAVHYELKEDGFRNEFSAIPIPNGIHFGHMNQNSSLFCRLIGKDLVIKYNNDELNSDSSNSDKSNNNEINMKINDMIDYFKNIYLYKPNNISNDIILLEIELLSSTSISQDNDNREDYSLVIDKSMVKIKSNSILGISNGLHSFGQLLFYNESMSLYHLCQLPFSFTDTPYKSFRSVYIDTTNSFVPKESFINIIKQLSTNKINKLHWQPINNEIFQIEVSGLTKLFNSTDIPFYSRDDLLEISTTLQKTNIQLILDLPILISLEHVEKYYGNMIYPIDLYDNHCLISNNTSNNNSSINQSRLLIFEMILDILKIFPNSLINIGYDFNLFNEFLNCIYLNENYKEKYNFRDITNIITIIKQVNTNEHSPFHDMKTNTMYDIIHLNEKVIKNSIIKLELEDDWQRIYYHEDFKSDNFILKSIGGELIFDSTSILNSRFFPMMGAFAEKLWTNPDQIGYYGYGIEKRLVNSFDRCKEIEFNK